MVVVSIKKIFSTTQLGSTEMLFWFFLLLESLASHCSEPYLKVILTEPNVRPLDEWGVEILDSALNNYEDFTICGRVMNYNFKRSSSTVWHRIVSTDDSMYLLVALAIDCEDIYNACTNHYKHYIGKVIKMSESLTLNMIKIEQELTSGREEDLWGI